MTGYPDETIITIDIRIIGINKKGNKIIAKVKFTNLDIN
jgi:hypothetical protein